MCFARGGKQQDAPARALRIAVIVADECANRVMKPVKPDCHIDEVALVRFPERPQPARGRSQQLRQ